MATFWVAKRRGAICNGRRAAPLDAPLGSTAGSAQLTERPTDVQLVKMKARTSQLALVLVAAIVRRGHAASCSDAEGASVADAFTNFQSSISSNCSGDQCASACVSTQQLLATALPDCEYVDGVNYRQKALALVAGCDAAASTTGSAVTAAPATSSDVTYAPVAGTSGSAAATATEAPTVATYAPAGATFAPVDITYAPVDTTDPVGTTTFAPFDTTYAPVDATYAPADVTYTPVAVTYVPVDTTYDPATVVPPSDAPVVVTNTPLVTEAPVGSTSEVPVVSTEIPVASATTEAPTSAPATVIASGSLDSTACSTDQGDTILSTYAEYQTNISIACGTDSCSADCVAIQSTVVTLLPDCLYNDGNNYYEKVSSELAACGVSDSYSGSHYVPSTVPCSDTQSNVTIILYRQYEAELKESCDADKCSTDCISIVNQLSSVLPDCLYSDGINYRNESISIIDSCVGSSSGSSEASQADDSSAASLFCLVPTVVGVAVALAAWI